MPDLAEQKIYSVEVVPGDSYNKKAIAKFIAKSLYQSIGKNNGVCVSQ